MMDRHASTCGNKSLRRFDLDQQNRDPSASQILLILEAFIHRQKNLEADGFSERKKTAIFLTGQARFRHGHAIVIGERALQFAGDTLVK
jgi:hypothetical protein